MVQAFSISERQANRDQREVQQYSRQYASSERERQERYNNKVQTPENCPYLVCSVVATRYPLERKQWA